ncbi:PREDICTED: RCC1 and BTB domain-containing protein 1-like isoform X2 [Polistes dominula]|uniref:RCC1 and BTB domain-containing protein 1-like isoform X2 n=1 Tax=Polistes dominula TaxID=743375 RepID=A0ABM1IUA2_POLDO|nr:PREDICTED: RCC1 and BTB domain-containing protein 1-like isoform X2 [Polistes dominula]
MSSELRNWPIFTLLEPKFTANIRMVVVYGNLGNEALIVTKDNQVFSLGCNITGCLGTGDTYNTLHPKKVEALCNKHIKTFAYGSGPHVLALTMKGEVYAWGHNGFCELGNGSTIHGLTPTRVGMPLTEKNVIDIACGSHHSLALTDEGEIYAWGQNNCGQTYSMAVTNSGEIYGWGHNGVGQLGNGSYANQLNPCKVAGLVGVIIEKVVCGYAHTLALSDEGVLYVWGSNSYGQLGLGNKTNTCVPMKLFIKQMGRVSDVAALHYDHISVAIGEGNKVFMWGQCLGQSITIPTPTPLTNLHDVLACYASPRVMHRPLYLYAAEESSIVDCLRDAFNDSTTSDLTIQVDGKPIHVHKAVLKIRCQYFRTMFQGAWAENSQTVIEHDQFSHDVYKSFLKYLYTDEVDLPPESALELLDLANVYCEAQLKKRCVQIIKKGITVLNVAFLYSTAIEYNAQELEDFCFKFALNHMTAVIQTTNFAKLDETTVKTFIIKAAQSGAFKT